MEQKVDWKHQFEEEGWALRLKKESESFEECVKRLSQRRAETMDKVAKTLQQLDKIPKWKAGKPGVYKDAYTPWPEDKLVQIEATIKTRIPGGCCDLLHTVVCVK